LDIRGGGNMQTLMDYDKTTGEIKGFYHKEIQGDKIPEGCIEITDEKHEFYLLNNGKYKIDVNTFEDIHLPEPELPAPENDAAKATAIDEISKATTIAGLRTAMLKFVNAE
jgi:hypothetical protein